MPQLCADFLFLGSTQGAPAVIEYVRRNVLRHDIIGASLAVGIDRVDLGDLDFSRLTKEKPYFRLR